MTSTSSSERESLPIWDYIPIADFVPPAAPVAHTAKKSFSQFLRILGQKESEPDALFETKNELQTLPQWQLDCIAPTPDWVSAAEAFVNESESWLNQNAPEQRVVLLVNPPHGGHLEILTNVAEQRSWRVLTPPTPEQIMAEDDSWISALVGDKSPWVFPGLEKAFLRDAAGINLIRRFLDEAYSGAMGQGIIGCDSWAWAYLRQIRRGRWPLILTLRAFDEAGLTDCFLKMAASGNQAHLEFRQSDNGRYVLPPKDEDEASNNSSSFLQLLATHSRGNLGVASAVWRSNLFTEPDEGMAEEQESTEHKMSDQTIWVTPPERLEHPLLPADASRDAAFVLHNLLLHNGLTIELLQHIGPLSPSQTMETLYSLAEASLVSQSNAIWKVTALGYPAVREFMHTNGYLVDQF